ncbi:MAG: aldehyde reductase [Lentisphaerae bacterium GWF2_52_8]|nr:MAG: aldehyde reductase [Lentisphaerae bacterium GWF2_52_8]
MENFIFHNPVKLVFGKGCIAQIPELLPSVQTIMLVYGGGSIKRNGVYDQVLAALKGRNLVEFAGIEPNPRYETSMKAVLLARQRKVDFILGVGGGSVLDAVKFIAAAVPFTGKDPWDILAKGAEVKAAVPIGAVLTLPATGSEMNTNSVISRVETSEKLHFSSPLVYPVFSILDPETSVSLPVRQTVNGIVDSFVHVMEQYMTKDLNTPLQDRYCEAIISTLVEESPKVLYTPSDYDVRANIMWCATNALNGWCSCGCLQDWATHMIGHELTAFYGIDHAQSLAIVLPELWRAKIDSKRQKLVQFGRRVFAVSSAEEAIFKTEEFFHSIGMKTKLSDYGIQPADASKKIYERFMGRGDVALGEGGDINAAAARDILLRC